MLLELHVLLELLVRRELSYGAAEPHQDCHGYCIRRRHWNVKPMHLGYRQHKHMHMLTIFMLTAFNDNCADVG